MTATILFTATCLLFVMMVPTRPHAQGQTETLRYKVLHNEESIGSLTVTRTCNADSCTYHMSTRVRTRLLFTFTTASDEESTLVNGSIVRSNFNRNLNGKKIEKTLYSTSNRYWMKVNGEWRDLGQMPSCPSSLSLYHEEPRQHPCLWSDNYMERLPVTPAGLATWKVDYPDGGNGFFHYENGVASRIEMHSTIYDYAIVLEKKY